MMKLDSETEFYFFKIIMDSKRAFYIKKVIILPSLIVILENNFCT